MALGARRLDDADSIFGIQAAGRLMTEIFAPWVQDLGLLVESIEATRPASAPPDWQPGAVIRLPFSKGICRDGAMCGQALLAAADAAMAVACAAACNGYRPMNAIDQTMHFLRPAKYDLLADARIVRVANTTTFGRVTLVNAADRQPVGMVSGAYAIV